MKHSFGHLLTSVGRIGQGRCHHRALIWAILTHERFDRATMSVMVSAGQLAHLTGISLASARVALRDLEIAGIVESVRPAGMVPRIFVQHGWASNPGAVSLPTQRQVGDSTVMA